MTAATLSRLPLTAGGAVAGSFARTGLWTLTQFVDLGSWAVAQFMRAPVAISVVAAVAGFSLLAGSNALYFQTHRHPAPLFFAPPKHVAPAPVVRPVIPAMRPRPQASIDNETTGSLGSSPAVDAIDNADVMALQKKLVAMKLLFDKADGVFGRHTASAIKAFEVKAGMKPRGQLTRQLLAAVLAAPVSGDGEALPAPTITVAARSTLEAPIGKPVPLAPPPPVSAPPTTNTATAAPADDTLAANSLPQADLVPATEAPAAAELPAAPAPQSTIPVTAPAADGSAMAMNNLPPVQPVAAPQAAAAPQQPATPAAASLTAAQRLAAQMGTLPPEATPASVAAPSANPGDPAGDSGSTDPGLITKIQRGLASLGFLAQKIDGVPGEGTAKAIRNFEVFYDYRVTGEATPQLLDLLVKHGAQT